MIKFQLKYSNKRDEFQVEFKHEDVGKMLNAKHLDLRVPTKDSREKFLFMTSKIFQTGKANSIRKIEESNTLEIL